MSVLKSLAIAAIAASPTWAYPPQLGFNTPPVVETRTLDQIYEAALKEGGTVTVWHGGDERNQQDAMKMAFESRFPGIKMNLTVDLSKYHDGNLDRQLANDDVSVDSVMLQTLHDFPRWKDGGAILNYKPVGFEEIYEDLRDDDGAYMGLFVLAWSNVFNPQKLKGIAPPVEYTDYLKPEFKNKLVLTIPNDDDAVLYQFDLIMKQYGYGWFEKLLAQNPRWARGTATPATLIASSNKSYAATFTSTIGFVPFSPFNITYPTEGTFTSWPQTGAILKDAPHPESAKLLHNWFLSAEHQAELGTWTVRKDLPSPKGYPSIVDMPGMDVTKFSTWMGDRAAVERLRFFFEDKLGSAQGLSPLTDDL